MSFKHSIMYIVLFLKSFLSFMMEICMKKQSSEGYNSCDHIPVMFLCSCEKFPLLEPRLLWLYAWKGLFHPDVGIFTSSISIQEFCYSWWKGGVIRRRRYVTNKTHETHSLWKALLWQQWSPASPACPRTALQPWVEVPSPAWRRWRKEAIRASFPSWSLILSRTRKSFREVARSSRSGQPATGDPSTSHSIPRL